MKELLCMDADIGGGIMCRLAHELDIPLMNSSIGVLTEEETQKSSEKMRTRITERQLLCILKDRIVIGFLGWSIGYEDERDVVYIEQITIRTDLRGEGVGKLVLNWFMELSRAQGFRAIIGEVDTDNTRSLALFTGVGGVCIEENEARRVMRIPLG